MHEIIDIWEKLKIDLWEYRVGTSGLVNWSENQINSQRCRKCFFFLIYWHLVEKSNKKSTSLLRIHRKNKRLLSFYLIFFVCVCYLCLKYMMEYIRCIERGLRFNRLTLNLVLSTAKVRHRALVRFRFNRGAVTLKPCSSSRKAAIIDHGSFFPAAWILFCWRIFGEFFR